MPLDPSQLGAGLRDRWLPADGSSFPASAFESGQRFADVVSQWFAGATAAAFPCATALARSAPLAATAAQAFQARSAPGAGLMLAQALALYLAGQVFGPGLSTTPAGAAALAPALAAALGDLGAERGQRADAMASHIHTTVLTTIVVFPIPGPPPSPVQ